MEIELTDDVSRVLEDENIDIVVELMGGIEKPYEIVKRVLENGKSVVTANKSTFSLP